MPSNGPFDLSQQPIHLDDTGINGGRAIGLTNFNYDGPSFEEYIQSHCDANAPGRLMMIEASPSSWTTWERHNDAAEIVYILRGKGVFIQEIDGEQVRIPVSPGVCLINPKGVWHTADVDEALEAIYLTPCPGTEHRPRQ